MIGRMAPTTVGADSPAPRRIWITALFVVGTVLFVWYVAWLAVGSQDYLPARDLLLYCLLLAIPVDAFIGRALIAGSTRTAWWFFAAGAATWLLADGGYVASTGDTGAATPTWINWLYIVSPAFFYVGALLLARVILPSKTIDIWLDALILASATVAWATLWLPSLLDNFAGSAARGLLRRQRTADEPAAGLDHRRGARTHLDHGWTHVVAVAGRFLLAVARRRLLAARDRRFGLHQRRPDRHGMAGRDAAAGGSGLDPDEPGQTSAPPRLGPAAGRDGSGVLHRAALDSEPDAEHHGCLRRRPRSCSAPSAASRPSGRPRPRQRRSVRPSATT